MSKIEFSDLPPKYQGQVKIKYAIQEAKRRNKLHAEKTEYDGEKFDSKKEAKRYAELQLMERTGQITDLRKQVKYVLIPSQTKSDGKKEREIAYIADFVYKQDGKEIVEDVKGYRNPSSAPYAKFVLKRKLMLWVHGIEVQEV